MDPLLLVIPVLLGAGLIVLLQRRVVAGEFADADARADAVEGTTVDDAGPLDWQEVLGVLRLDPSEALPPVEHPRLLGSVARATADSEDMLRPLGLTIAEMARIDRTHESHVTTVRGKNRIEGRRHGRDVRIGYSTKSGKVELRGTPSAQFVVRGRGGTLTVEGGAPDAVRSTVEALRPSKRWSGVRVTGGGDSITVTRDGNDPARAWMHDLWLAERLAEAASG
jgi:hypothetical protein